MMDTRLYEKTLRDKILEAFYESISNEEERETQLKGAVSVTKLVHPCFRHAYYSVKIDLPIADPSGVLRMWKGRKLHETKVLKDAIMEFEIEWGGTYLLRGVDGSETEVYSHTLVDTDRYSRIPIYQVYRSIEEGNPPKYILYRGEEYPEPTLEKRELGLLGHVDEYSPGLRLVLDKKTTNKGIPRKAYDHHVKQVMYYAVMLKSIGYDVEAGAILYIDVAQDLAEAFVFPIENLLETQAEMTHKLDTLREYLVSNRLPPRIVKTWTDNTARLVCSYCPFFSPCMRNIDFRVLGVEVNGGD